MNTRMLAAATLAAAILGGGTLAFAQTGAAPAAPAPAEGTLTVADLTDRLAKQGYGAIKKIERKGDKLYKVEVQDARNGELELYVDARNAEILASERDD
ncbi:PepSY domain-containing protein [Azospirillum sp.]|uniref:PepSY domain-containing protein n=1 Tax=Azospirillum sp. TaxID=34012 RepID=UPI002D254B9D|nr:PepSY domain-containing protein [Azospirillum sp.]HYD67573.1 PepSY domain-containing protein [Azospirillum sp.]